MNLSLPYCPHPIERHVKATHMHLLIINNNKYVVLAYARFVERKLNYVEQCSALYNTGTIKT